MSYADFLPPTMLLIGVGFALTFPAINTQATDGVADREQGLAAGLVTTGGQLLPHMTTAIGVVAGVTIVGVVGTLARLARLRIARPRVAPDPACAAC